MISLLPFNLLNFWSIRTLNIFDWITRGISETWSINNVPLLAFSRAPYDIVPFSFSSPNSSNSYLLLSSILDSNKYELELFGEEKENGTISYGALEKANKGTLLIDQVSEIPLVIQSKILRVLIDQKFKRLNGNNDINVDVRLICSSSKDLKDEIKIGNFREDLYHRLNVFEINIKSLNERISDIPLLIRYFSKINPCSCVFLSLSLKNTLNRAIC